MHWLADSNQLASFNSIPFFIGLTIISSVKLIMCSTIHLYTCICEAFAFNNEWHLIPEEDCRSVVMFSDENYAKTFCLRSVITGRNHMFPYFWNVAETCSSMVPLYIRLAETWKLKSAWFRHVSGTEMSSHVSVIFKPADFRCSSFPSCFCKQFFILPV